MKPLKECLEVNVSDGVNAPTKSLIWDIFFVSRGRAEGSTLLSHFPWMNSVSDVYSVTIERINEDLSNEIVGCLVIKLIDFAQGQRIGLVGLVCVKGGFRGFGLSKNLISRACKLSKDKKLKGLVLWAVNPSIYSSQGFEVDGYDYICNAKYHSDLQTKVAFNSSPLEIGSGISLPPFAKRARIIRAKNAQVIILETNLGITVAEWSGSDSNVVSLLLSALGKDFLINCAPQDPLIQFMLLMGFELHLRPSATRLVKWFGGDSRIKYVLPKFNVISRI